jgi:hypothetical protein
MRNGGTGTHRGLLDGPEDHGMTWPGTSTDAPAPEGLPPARRTLPGGRHPVTVRALVIGLIGAAAACFVVTWAELVVSTIQIAICQFAPAAIGLVLIVVVLNVVLRFTVRRFSLHPHEIIVIYLMILVSALTTSRGLLERWIPTLVAVNYYSTEANHWESLFYPHIPQWAVAFDVKGGLEQGVSTRFYESLPPGRPLPLKPWLAPLGAWYVVILALFFAYACLAAILRRQWVDHEKLSFPLIYLPLEMARDQSAPTAFFRNRLTWLGFALPTIIFGVNGLHELMPAIPKIPLEFKLNEAFRALGKPWSDLGHTTAYCSLAAMGFSYFLPSQVLVSLWSFFAFCRLQNIIFSAAGAGVEAMPLYPTTLWNGYQVMGAYLVLSAYLVKSAWPHLQKLWQQALRNEQESGPREFLSPRTAVWGLLLASAVAVYWFAALGMSVWMAIVEVVVFLFVVVVVMARSVSEAGMLMTETSFRPVDLVRIFTTQHALGRSTLSALSLADAVFTRDLRGNLLSTFLDGLKMSDSVQLDRRQLLWSLGAALGVTLTLGVLLHLIIPYRYGAVTLYGYAYKWNSIAGFRHFQPIMENADRYDARLPIFFLSGVGLTLFLAWMRTQYVWWPFSPLGFALSGSWSMIVFWFPVFAAWALKGLIMRYGGMNVYLRLRPFFLGLILGEFSQAVLWAAIASIWRTGAPLMPWS